MSFGSDAWKVPPNADARFAPPPLNFRDFAGPGVKLAYHLAPLEPLVDGVGYRLIVNGVVGVVGTETGPRDAFGVRLSFVDSRDTVEAACVVADRAIEGIIGCLTSLASGTSDATSPVLVSTFTLETAEGLVVEGESSVWEQPVKMRWASPAPRPPSSVPRGSVRLLDCVSRPHDNSRLNCARIRHAPLTIGRVSQSARPVAECRFRRVQVASGLRVQRTIQPLPRRDENSRGCQSSPVALTARGTTSATCQPDVSSNRFNSESENACWYIAGMPRSSRNKSPAWE